MKLLEKIKEWTHRERALVLLLLLTFALRIFGIGFGLPLTLVSDEPPFTLVALKMIETHALIPALQPDAFAPILLYPLYLSYVLVIPFVVILGVKYLLWDGSREVFEATLLSDLSPFFMTARVVNILLGMIMVYFVYEIAKSLYRSRVAAIASGYLVATSILHQALSMVGRHWMPSSTVFLLVLFVLTRDIPKKRRYLCAAVVAGVGMGFSTLSVLSVPFIALYYLIFDRPPWREMIQDVPLIPTSGALFAGLAAVPLLLYRSGNAFLGSITLFGHKTTTAFLESPWTLLSLNIYSEPVLIGLFLVGVFFLLKNNRNVAALIFGWFLMYAAIFYIVFRFDPRFALVLIPFYALAGGYAIDWLWGKRTAAALVFLLLIPLGVATRVEYLAYRGDTREIAREWALLNMGPADKVLVYVANMRLPTTAAAVEELRTVDSSVVRKTDDADIVLNRTNVPHTLNHLFPMKKDSAFIRDISLYARDNRYTHLIFAPEYAAEATSTAEAFDALASNATEIKRFDGRGPRMSIADSSFANSFFELFDDRYFGPTIIVYSMHYETR